MRKQPAKKTSSAMKQAILQGKDRNFSGTTPLRGVFLLKKIKEDGIMSKNVGCIFFNPSSFFSQKIKSRQSGLLRKSRGERTDTQAQPTP